MVETAKIAIVDDDQEIREAIMTLVETVGLRAEGFSSAEEFLSSPQAQDSACLILDVRMPGMSGFELQRQLVAAHWRTPIIFVTAYADDDVRGRALAAGAVAVLAKPCREADLLQAIEAALRPS
jgi:FixJ family two-component response regulator